VDGVLKGLESSLAQTGAQVTHDALPTVKGDLTLLGQVFQNLLENAIKYRGAEAPRVHVAAREGTGKWVFSVIDNGIGIDPRHFDRLFQIFQRLHRDESRYPGLGVGLAMCKRIVENHGGRIWVESQPGRGSTFSFTLPA
jgi:signal transduction histidine kinase